MEVNRNVAKDAAELNATDAPHLFLIRTMAESDASSSNEITINIKGPSELKLSLTLSPSKSVLDLKTAIAERSNVPADSQRLIYSGL